MRRRREPSVVRSEGRPSRRDEQAVREELGNTEFADAVEKILMWSTSATQAQRDLEEQFRRRIERHQQKQQQQHQQQQDCSLDCPLELKHINKVLFKYNVCTESHRIE